MTTKANIFRETVLSWEGEDYDLVPSMKLLRKIERGRPGEGPVSIVQVTNQSMNGNPQISLMSTVIEDVMHHAGATDFSGDLIYQEFHHGDTKAVIALWHQVIEAISPVPKEQKKAVDRGQK